MLKNISLILMTENIYIYLSMYIVYCIKLNMEVKLGDKFHKYR